MVKLPEIEAIVIQLKEAADKDKDNDPAITATDAEQKVDSAELTKLQESLKQLENRTKEGFKKMKAEIDKTSAKATELEKSQSEAKSTQESNAEKSTTELA